MRDTRFDQFFFKGTNSDTAILLLHGYGGNPLEMKQLGRSLHNQGYTVFAPVYSGHGLHNLRAFINTKVSLWYDDALYAYDTLQKQYPNIIVCGLSLGGAFTIRIAMDRQPAMIVPMSAPVFGFNSEQIHQQTKHQVDHSTDIIDKDKARYAEIFAHQKIEISTFYKHIENPEHLSEIACPVMIVQGLKDHQRFIDSAHHINNHLTSPHQLCTYEHSGHVITMGDEQDKLSADIITFITQ